MSQPDRRLRALECLQPRAHSIIHLRRTTDNPRATDTMEGPSHSRPQIVLLHTLLRAVPSDIIRLIVEFAQVLILSEEEISALPTSPTSVCIRDNCDGAKAEYIAKHHKTIETLLWSCGDEDASKLLSKRFPSLTRLMVTNSYGFGDDELAHFTRHSPHLRFVLLSYSGVGLFAIRRLTQTCPELWQLVYRPLGLGGISLETYSSVVVKSIANLGCLKSLSLHASDLISEEAVCHVARHCRSLTSLTVSMNRSARTSIEARLQMGDVALETLVGNCSDLVDLDIGGWAVTDRGILALAHALPYIETFRLGYCDFGYRNPAVTDTSVCSLARSCRRLTTLDLAGCSITTRSLSAFCDFCPKLKCLWV